MLNCVEYIYFIFICIYCIYACTDTHRKDPFTRRVYRMALLATGSTVSHSLIQILYSFIFRFFFFLSSFLCLVSHLTALTQYTSSLVLQEKQKIEFPYKTDTLCHHLIGSRFFVCFFWIPVSCVCVLFLFICTIRSRWYDSIVFIRIENPPFKNVYPKVLLQL